VKALEEYGIGRPSTYASIIQTLLFRKYVKWKAAASAHRRRPRGQQVPVQPLHPYVDYDFTAKLEDELDAVSRGEEEWVPLMARFWGRSRSWWKTRRNRWTAPRPVARASSAPTRTGKPVSVRLGRFGPMPQIGTVEDEEKPKFASLQPGQSMHTISLEDALNCSTCRARWARTTASRSASASAASARSPSAAAPMPR
jgi:DNA topoisomerase-1